MSTNDCECPSNEPQFVLNPAIGTAPCAAVLAGATSTTPCDISACCNYFRTEEAQGANNFIFSAGGPFAFSGATNLLSPEPGFINPGPLDGIVCVPDLAPGTYEIEVRMEATLPTGSFVLAAFFPSCDDTTTAYQITECSAPGTDVVVTCTGFIYAEVTSCTPGFELLGCGATISNFQISIRRVSGRTVVDCGGSNLLPLNLSQFPILCGL
jgi:hypothetical protein